ncbi:MAG: GNAT family N-acetyltransferase [Dehalococcoidia bacterium]|nr:GNAT family N-acetyltransferase [Dehalococcoidia bacterium]HCV00617.1 N-acetyltransferase [Dehalococcoidia bacterium]|tara:strand:+ start:11802 stop:12284 length:483 start_codon:yes stop_codon:yes gene_type:complete
MVCVEPALLSDTDAIYALIDHWAQRGEMLERPHGYIREAIGDFKVAREDGEIVACGSLHVMGSDLAEIRALAVREDQHGKGVGAAVVEACVEEGRGNGIERVFALTYQPGFFERQGFVLANVMDFPEKVWTECLRCPFVTNCREIAVVRDLGLEAEAPAS